jgi:hypothetical protein
MVTPNAARGGTCSLGVRRALGSEQGFGSTTTQPLREMRARVLLWLLVAGSAVNMAAGARRVFEERRILSTGYYPAADRAAAAILTQVPEGAALAVVGYKGDTSPDGLVDIPTWIDYRLKWLLYPRRFDAYRFTAPAAFEKRAAYAYRKPGFAPVRTFEGHEYALFFRVAQRPELPNGRVQVLADDPSFVLLRLGRP